MVDQENEGRVGYSRCFVPGCRSRTGQGIKLRPFPKRKNPELQARWKAAMPQSIVLCRSTAICELHFGPDQFERVRQDGRRKFKQNAVPAIFESRVPFGDLKNLPNLDHDYLPKCRYQFSQPMSISNSLELSEIDAAEAEKAEAGSVEILRIDFGVEDIIMPQRSNSENTGIMYEDNNMTTPLINLSDLSDFSGSKKSEIVDKSVTFEETLSMQGTSEMLLDFESGYFTPKPREDSREDKVNVEPAGNGLLFHEHTNIHSTPLQFSSSHFYLDERSGLLTDSPCDPPDCPSSPIFSEETSDTKQILPVTPSRMSKEELLQLIRQKDTELDRLSKLTEEKDNELSQLRAGHFSTCTFKLKYDSMRRAKERIENAYKKDLYSPWLSDSRLQKLLQRLQRKSNRGLKWDTEDFRDGLILKMKCGSSGYSAFVKMFPVLPSVRSLQETVQFIRFDAGILDEVFDLLEMMVKYMSAIQKFCSLVLDEIAIEEGIRYDNSLKKFVGSCSLESHSGKATKALVFLLAGTSVRWKIAVAVHFTKSKSDDAKGRKSENLTGSAYAGCITSVIKRAATVGLTVKAIVSDMGPDNLAFWKHFGVTGSKKAEVVSSFSMLDSPSTPFEVFVLPDSVHLQKAIKAMMESNGIIKLPADTVQKEGLPSDIVHYSHIDDLYEYESGSELKVAFRLRKSNIHCSKHFKKMKVGATKAVICHRTGVGLKHLSKEKHKPEYETTAWFIMLLNTFFTLVTCRSKGLAISTYKKNAFDKAINLIKKVDYVFTNMKVGADGAWKPAQRGMRVLCASLLGLIEFYVTGGVYQYLILGRFTSDCIENLFSCIRLCQSIPHAIALLQCLKVITLAQFSEAVRGSSYEYEDSTPLTLEDFLEESRRRAKERALARCDQSTEELIDNKISKLTPDDYKILLNWEDLVIYDMAGSVISSILSSNVTVCKNCIDAAKWTEDSPHPKAGITSMKEFTDLRADDGTKLLLTYVSDWVYKAVRTAEVTFRLYREKCMSFNHTDVKQYFIDGLMYVWDGSEIPNCHDLGRKILTTYFDGRLKEFGKVMREKAKESNELKPADRSSKSIAMHQAADKMETITAKKGKGISEEPKKLLTACKRGNKVHELPKVKVQKLPTNKRSHQNRVKK